MMNEEGMFWQMNDKVASLLGFTKFVDWKGYRWYRSEGVWRLSYWEELEHCIKYLTKRIKRAERIHNEIKN